VVVAIPVAGPAETAGGTNSGGENSRELLKLACVGSRTGVPINSERETLCLVVREGIVATLSEGQYVKHFQYGCGVITEFSQDRTTIDFDAHGIKKFVTSIMIVEPAEGTPPKRRRAKRVKAVKAEPMLAARVFVPGAK
jgi:hypothetical protein